MEEEFQESDVIFQENISNEEIDEENDQDYKSQNCDFSSKVQRKKAKRVSNSVPINIPENLSRNSSWFKYVENESNHFEDGKYGEREMVPPHVITGRRIAEKMMSFSICSGYGRTLKGRDLSQVRNSILRMTGFLETLLLQNRFGAVFCLNLAGLLPVLVLEWVINNSRFQELMKNNQLTYIYQIK
ncbi:hypothetical protein RND71_020579 [Anisodus tanguticus]|uniref:Uncharacterized protein n=1 Tax=Anisodus tanguticus TaxID=243964 RepID=A0AAE1VAH5_9SOLA|nr:hypothetical protein RND71_020579 [Anisodus tanguticus]